MAERALVVEDDVLQARAVRRALQSNFDVVEATDARTARSILRRRQDFALVILDVHLPDADLGGCALFDEFHSRMPHAVFVIMTADLRARIINHATPRALFVAKPFDTAVMRGIAQTALLVPANDPVVSANATMRTASWQLSITERRLIASHLDGKTKTETCAALGFSRRTHESHVRHILSKAARAGAGFNRLSDLIHHLLRNRHD